MDKAQDLQQSLQVLRFSSPLFIPHHVPDVFWMCFSVLRTKNTMSSLCLFFEGNEQQQNADIASFFEGQNFLKTHF